MMKIRDNYSSAKPKTCRVEAPSDLPEGYKFDATVDGITFLVTVPAGGVTQGQILVVPYPSSSASSSSSRYPPKQAQTTTPLTPPPPTTCKSATTTTTTTTGNRWSTELCDCFNAGGTILWWMGCFCQPILLGQVMHRMHLNPGGCPGHSNSTCQTVTVLWVVAFLISVILAFLKLSAILLLYVFFIYFLVATIYTRMYVRNHYHIAPTSCEEEFWDDCCYGYCCSCCVTIQMHRQTHDSDLYPYTFYTPTGLPPHAPAIV